MNMFARFDENPAMTLRVIKETKRYGRTEGRTDGRMHGRTDGQRENSIPPTNKVSGGYNILERWSPLDYFGKIIFQYAQWYLFDKTFVHFPIYILEELIPQHRDQTFSMDQNNLNNFE